ncbi:NADH-quinone oxidoreductase subunit I [Pontibacter sp. 172403-2]|uniref:NuoI/complex I 23 kDa subunit family protein n=1 Tax=Pontibacter rufus TaxID=2791028 RepID=UPI0018AF91BA|nr:NADH-quinone oxidoreductase subunit I [Pontibacter sp. 172403-2]MBF9255361.1 NADH-quinone oxidoreductase subunit I [Pontibacter sp. 172403-2]
MEKAIKHKSGFRESVQSLLSGLRLTWRHFRNARSRRTPEYVSDKNYFSQPDGLVTLKYPYEALPVPDNGRYRLHNEIDDCIVCDLCAKVCPVNCITIESVKATEEIGATSDGTKKRLFAPVFDIDMAKCCYCGLCTTVCPTDCLTMTPVYDFAEVNIKNMIYHFTDLTPEEAEEKKQLLARQQEEMAAAKAAALAARKQA